jgi:hypothetical protein
MGETFAKTSFSAGEIAPALYGRFDLAKWHAGCSVARNVFVDYKGGLASRAGSAFVGACKQPTSGQPPRLITFKFNLFQSYLLEFGDFYMRVITDGAYVTEAPKQITSASKANPCQVGIAANNFNNGDWIYITGVQGMTALNGRTFIVAGATSNSVLLTDIFGTPVNSLNYGTYTGGGTVARIYTLMTPYAAVDLPYLKFTQSADTMSLTCVNQQTLVEYPPQELTRLAANNWTIAQPSFKSSTSAPASCSVTANKGYVSGAGPAAYGYVVTAVDATTGQESIASPIGACKDSVDISGQFGSNTVTWAAVANASSYNIYRAPPDYTNTENFVGQLFGYAGTSRTTTWQDTNIQPDFTTTPPLHNNPFARGAILASSVTAVGAGYSQATVTVTINSATGSGAVIQARVDGTGALADLIVQNPGEGYKLGDTITIGDGVHGGAGATGTITIGSESGTYPAVVEYFQQRRGYMFTLNNPDGYNFSQPGAFLNFDTSNPTISSDAISGSPWSKQVNGIQWALPMPGGCIIATGEDAWQLSGTTGAGSAITPSQQNAQPQESNGFNPTLPPIKINYDIIYGQSLGSIIRDLQYNFFTNIYAGTDITVLSSHLFINYQIKQWAWAREPNKIIWAVRDDGKLLSCTYLKEQDVIGWTRHDTNGLVQSIATAPEPPVDAVYLVVKRYIPGPQQWMYYVERFDNRLWSNVEQTWCVDCGLSLPQTEPNATLQASRAAPSRGISGGTIVLGGSNYTAPVGQVVDQQGNGSGAQVTLSLSGGAINGMTVVNPGNGYVAPVLQIQDSTGSGAEVILLLDFSAVFTASAAVFGSDVGKVIRLGGGIAVVTKVNSPIQVVADINKNITATVPNDPNNLPIPAQPGQWSLTNPVSSVGGLDHLEGMQVSVLADGSVAASPDNPLTVTGGSITLPSAASQITIGLPFTAQVQTLHADVPGAMIQGKHKRINSVTMRLWQSRGIRVGQDQPVAAQTENQAERPWGSASGYLDLSEMTDRRFGLTNANAVYAGSAVPLFSGDVYVPIQGDWNTPDYQRSPGMVAMQQTYPLPMTILACMPSLNVGDTGG